jgi:hypothetical protein
MFYGVNQYADKFVETLGLTRKDFGRFRNASLFKDEAGYIIRVTTRNAGSREQYKATDQFLASHKLFIRRCDDTFDDTYRYYFFHMSQEMKNEVSGTSSTKLEEMVDNKTINDKSDEVVTAVKTIKAIKARQRTPHI